jgi:rod shape determining protein RodA
MKYRLSSELRYIDMPMLYALLTFMLISLATLYSASNQSLVAIGSQLLRYAFGFVLMYGIAQLRPETLRHWSPIIYGVALFLLLVVLVIGVVGKGAQRWIALGPIRLQPSELMKLGVPMMLAWAFSRASLPPRLRTIGFGLVIIAIPVLLIRQQPDLGTALMILASGLVVIFLAGISWWLLGALIGSGIAAAPLVWSQMQAYQKQRVLTFLNPESDPLGTGYHIIQSKIAIGSGGLFGKGWLESSQGQLGYLPEQTTDFIFAVFAEDFGFAGVLLLVALYLFVIGRGLMIAYSAQDSFSRLLAGSLSITLFLYFLVNTGMVTGMLPVVGVPLPLVSHGGSSLVTLLASIGVLMSIQTHRKLVEH